MIIEHRHRETDGHTERVYRQKVTCMNTDVDVLTEHLLQRERERERRMGGTHEVERRHRQTYG